MQIFKKKEHGAIVNVDDITYCRINNKDRFLTIGPDKVICNAKGKPITEPRMVILATQMFYGNIRNNRLPDGTMEAKLEDYLFMFWVCPLNPEAVSPELPQGVLCSTPLITRAQQNFSSYQTQLVGKNLIPSSVVSTVEFTTYATKKEPKAGTVEFATLEATESEEAYLTSIAEWLDSEVGASGLVRAVEEILNNYNVIMLEDAFTAAARQRKQFRSDFYGTADVVAEIESSSGAELLSLPASFEEIPLD